MRLGVISLDHLAGSPILLNDFDRVFEGSSFISAGSPP
jgi:hypothetical protein